MLAGLRQGSRREKLSAHLNQTRSEGDLELRQCLLEPVDAVSGDLCVLEIEKREAGQSLEVRKAGVRDFASRQEESFEVSQPAQVCEPGVRHAVADEVQVLEAGQGFQLREAGIGYLGLPKFQAL